MQLSEITLYSFASAIWIRTLSGVRRIFAFLIDAIIVSLFELLPFAGGLIGFLYMLLRDGITDNGSIGKKLLNLQLTTITGHRSTFQESIRRNIIFAIPSLFAIIPVIGIFISFVAGIIVYVLELSAMWNDPEAQRHGDHWAGTLVREAPIYYR